jgi:hypothetical protein
VLSPNQFSAPPRAPEVLSVSQVQAAIIVMSGILIIPLWKKAKFWSFVFQGRDSFNAMFDSVIFDIRLDLDIRVAPRNTFSIT